MAIQLNQILTKTENKELEKLFLAIYFNDIDKVIEFKNNYPEIYKKKDSFKIDDKIIFDLTNLTLFNQIIWNDSNWRKEIMPFIQNNRRRTKHMLDYWCEELGQEKIHWQIEYNRYCNYFYCDDPNDPVDNEEVILDPISYFSEKGFREIDLRLYNRVECFDFAAVRNLLEQGAKSNIDFYDDEDSNAISRISGERSFLATCEIIPEFKSFETEGYNQNFDIARMFGDLLGLAAHEQMYNLLNEFSDEES